MRKSITLFLISLITLAAFSQTGHQITVTIKAFKNQYIFLGYHYGKLKALADSVKLNAQGTGTLTGSKPYPGGIYFIVSPKKEILFEMLLDKQQRFSVSADTGKAGNQPVFLNSPDNTQFQAYTRFIGEKGTQMTSLQSQLASAKTADDSASLHTQITKVSNDMQVYRETVAKQQPGSFLATLLRALKEPPVPADIRKPGAAYDSTAVYYAYKNHYWDYINLADERMIRTPIFENKLDKYLREIVVPQPDSLIREADFLLAKAAPNKQMYQFLLTHLVQEYITPKYMGQDAVFVHLFEKYINNNRKIDWFTPQYQKYMSDRAYSMMANLLGQPAQELIMVDTTGQPASLFSVKAPYTIVCFWDPTCSHCQEMVPKLDSMYQRKWKAMGVKIYGVMVDGGKPAWLKYIHDNNLKDWIHVYQTSEQRDADNAAGKPSYQQLYDVFQTPVLYLLDADKRIIAKKLTYEQIDEVLAVKMKQTQPAK